MIIANTVSQQKDTSNPITRFNFTDTIIMAAFRKLYVVLSIRFNLFLL